MEKYEFSLFSSLSDRKPQTITLDQFEEMISGDEWHKQVSAVRAIKDSDARKAAKKKLPAVTISGIFSGSHKASALQKHSGLICMDFDLKDNPSLAGGAESMREKLAKDKYSKLVFVSVGGEGLAVICEIDPEQHKPSFIELSSYFKNEYGLIADNSCRDVSRLRFVSWDDSAGLNEEARAIPLALPSGGVELTKRSIDTIEKRSGVSRVSMEQTCSAPIHRLKEAQQFIEAFEDDPSHELYDRLVTRKLTVKRGERNMLLTTVMVPFLFKAVAESVCMKWCEAFYHYHAGIFTDTIELHLSEAKFAWDSCLKNYYDTLTANEQEYFNHIAESKSAGHELALFRISKSLSQKISTGLFQMSKRQAAIRLGLKHDEQGKRIIGKLHYEYGIIDLEIPGCSRSKGKRGISNTYRWMIGGV